MANSTPDITISAVWTNLNVAAGIAVGSQMIIQNKSSNDAFVWVGATAPLPDEAGYLVEPAKACIVESGEANPVWAYADGPLFVQ